jgi:uncharacterized membrane protein YedE/YeeE
MWADPGILLTGALTGLVFGFLLQKGGVTRFQVIVGQFLLKDFTMLKVMLSAVIVGGVGIYGMRTLGMDVSLHVKNLELLGNAVGGLIFGVGMVILGYCPGTGVAALGDGSRHAFFGVLGMVAGAALYAEAYPFMKSDILGVGAGGKETFVTMTGLSPWWFILLIVVVVGLFLGWLERWERRQISSHPLQLEADRSPGN